MLTLLPGVMLVQPAHTHALATSLVRQDEMGVIRIVLSTVAVALALSGVRTIPHPARLRHRRNRPAIHASADRAGHRQRDANPRRG